MADFPIPPAAARWVDMALSPDGKILAARGSEDIELRDASSGKLLRSVALRTKTPSGLTWAPQGKMLAVMAESGVALCDAATGEVLRTLPDSKDPLRAIAWSPDGQSLAGGPIRLALRENVRIRDAHSGEVRRTFDSQMYDLSSLQWLRDGSTLVIGDRGDEVGMLEADTGKLIRMVDTGVDEVSAHGRLAVLGGPSFIRLVSLPEGCTLCMLLCLRDGRFAVISPDGHFRGSPDVEKELVYVVQTDAGQETLSPEEFSKRYAWKNDPEKVTLKTEPGGIEQ